MLQFLKDVSRGMGQAGLVKGQNGVGLVDTYVFYTLFLNNS